MVLCSVVAVAPRLWRHGARRHQQRRTYYNPSSSPFLASLLPFLSLCGCFIFFFVSLLFFPPYFTASHPPFSLLKRVSCLFPIVLSCPPPAFGSTFLLTQQTHVRMTTATTNTQTYRHARTHTHTHTHYHRQPPTTTTITTTTTNHHYTKQFSGDGWSIQSDDNQGPSWVGRRT